MSTQLTAQQQAEMQKYIQRGIEIGRMTQPNGVADLDITEIYPILVDIYKEGGVQCPPIDRVEFVRSPREGIARVAELTGGAKSSILNETCYGNHDISWLSYYAFMFTEMGYEKCGRLMPLMRLTSKCGWWWPLDTHVIIAPMPSELHVNARGALHRSGGPALTYIDAVNTRFDTSIYSLNGVQFYGAAGRRWVVTPVDELDPVAILGITNVEQRQEVIKRVGIHKMWTHLQPKELDKMGKYVLQSIRVGNNQRVYLQMQNPSEPKLHIEAVPPECGIVEQALNWRNFGKFDIGRGEFVQPLVLT